jgi:hypothetical protein
MRKLILRGLAATAVVALPVVPAALPAAADEPLQQGWWTSTNPGGPTLPKSPPSDVPADGLLVQGGASGPTALSALVYSIDNGATVGQLRLTVASNTGTTPAAKLEVCPLADASMVPEQGGPMSDAPSYDCKTNVTASPDKSKTYAFNVARFVSRGDLAVAILATKSTDRVVFNKPSASSLTVTQPAAPPPPSDRGFGSPPTPASGPAPAPAAPAGNASLGAPPVQSGQSLPAPVATPPAPQVAPTPTPTTTPMPNGFAAASTGPGPGKSSPAAVGLALGGVALAAGLWAYAGRTKPETSPEEV